MKAKLNETQEVELEIEKRKGDTNVMKTHLKLKGVVNKNVEKLLKLKNYYRERKFTKKR